MAVKAVEREGGPIEAVCERIAELLGRDHAGHAVRFARQFYRWVPEADLVARSAEDLAGAALAHFRFSEHRAPGETKVQVYNPTVAEQGWESEHTVVQIVSDDMPFIVDSVTMELARQGCGLDLVIHPVIRVRRDRDGRLTTVVASGEEAEDDSAESVFHAEVDREPDPESRKRLAETVERVLDEVRRTVEDWQPMRERALSLADTIEGQRPPVSDHEHSEVVDFLRWLTQDNFTLIGYREYDLVEDVEDGRRGMTPRKGSGLGILRGHRGRRFTPLTDKAWHLAKAPHLLVLTKANSRSTVHRPAYLDYVGVKHFDESGEVIGECRFLGLYTTRAHKSDVQQIPLVRGTVAGVMARAGFPPDSHDAKALLEIIETYPRESLFQMETDELFDIAVGILALGERQRVRLFVRRDPLGRFVECLVCIPRDRFNTENREKVGRVLLEQFGGSQLDWTLQLSESLLARVHYIIRCPGQGPRNPNPDQVEQLLALVTRAWSDDLRAALIDECGEDDGLRLFSSYERAFPPAYRTDWTAQDAVHDIARLEQVRRTHEPIVEIYQPMDSHDGPVRCKLVSFGGVSLSDVLPTFEHLGAKVIDERPYEVRPVGGAPSWIYDFGLRIGAQEVEPVRDRFEEAFLAVWRGDTEDDGLNGLVLAGGLTAREVTILRAIAKYLRQAGIAFSDAYVQRTMLSHPKIASLLVALFKARFEPGGRDVDRAEQLQAEISRQIDAVESLDEDRILRHFLTVACATLRTNYFRRDGDGRPPGHLSFKLDPSRIGFLPRPRPAFEIFVHSPRVEGVHLRGGHVARGGLRWSDRREDFRTEILGLMKAQMVKNALIVPVGSKGGFIVKRPPSEGGREALLAEGIACYRAFLSGLLDITDNIVEGEVVAPDRVVRYDEDDPYLVVAADKGTASFSDIANEVSAEYGFWLGDAFASGGSQGYDHKQMGITARGAWESVKRHFRELGVDIGHTDFTVVGVGDMSGDVFGNGMLLSRHIKLIAAFNHQHVFLDPDPDPEASFVERKRLFELPRSAWSDYDPAAISVGGGVYPREAKSIKLSPEIRRALEIDAEELSPTELIREILRAPVDLLWNGGIGTYVKAAGETHSEAGDKANDAVRVDGDELRCRVVGEGGNLGFTQRGRIEYASEGGRINTDAIDNVAGVNTSDHEVNIKILLDAEVADGRLTEDERNALLADMTERVADSVLYASYTQTQALSLARAQSASMIDVHARLIRRMEEVGGLDRELEYLPSEAEINERKSAQRGLLTPEIAVLMAYNKIFLYARLLDSDLPEDEYLGHDLARYFPPPLPKRYDEEMQAHRLRREIIATIVANQIVDRAGSTFAFRLGEETGAPPPMLARGYAVAREVFAMREFWTAVEHLDNEVAAEVQLEMLIDGRRLVERATRWLVRANPDGIDIAALIEDFEPGVERLTAALPEVLHGADREAFDVHVHRLREAGVPRRLARRVAAMFSLLAVFDIVEVVRTTGREQEMVMEAYFTLAARLDFNWLRDRILELPRANRWQALARAAMRDDLYTLHRILTREVLESAGADDDPETAIEAWAGRHAVALERCLSVIADIRASRTYDMTTLPVGLRELRNLIRTGAAAQTAPG